MMSRLFILARLPFFAAGLILLTLYIGGCVLFVIGAAIAGLPLWIIFVVPAQFVFFALANDRNGFLYAIRHAAKQLATLLVIFPAIPRLYRDLYRWFIGHEQDSTTQTERRKSLSERARLLD